MNLRIIKFRRFVGSLLYPLQRDRLERQFRPCETSEPCSPGKLLRVEPTKRGGYFYFEQAEVEVCFLTPDLVRVDWKPGTPPIPYGISRHEWQEVETALDKSNAGVVVSSSTLKVAIAADGSLEFQNCEGQTLRQELPPQRQGEAWTHQARLRSEEHIYGLGERAVSLDLRRPKTKEQRVKAYQMWNYDAGGIYSSGTDPLYLCIPVYLGLHQQGSYLVFYENTYRANFTFTESATASFAGGALRYYFTSGSPPEMLERYTELTSRPPLPPRWAFGYHQSRWGYETEEEVRKTAKGFQTHNLPLSAIHLDIDVQVGYRAFTIDPDRFPNLASFTQELADLGVRFITINNPGIKYNRQSNLFLEGRVLDAFVHSLTASLWLLLCGQAGVSSQILPTQRFASGGADSINTYLMWV